MVAQEFTEESEDLDVYEIPPPLLTVEGLFGAGDVVGASDFAPGLAL